MRKDEVPAAVEQAAFDFFFWFSRLEFALKENGYLRSKTPGARAEPGWHAFVIQFKAVYTCSPAARQLLVLAPKRQIVLGGGGLDFAMEAFHEGTSDLERVTRLLKNIRNNLFHGGKHTHKGWDDPGRTLELLKCGLELMPELAKMGGLEQDFTGYY